MSIYIGTIIISIIFSGAGILSVLAAICNWNWFFTSQNSRMLTGKFTRTTARIIYLVLGCLILTMATLNALPIFQQ